MFFAPPTALKTYQCFFNLTWEPLVLMTLNPMDSRNFTGV